MQLQVFAHLNHMHFLPIINLKPTDESCIYSTLTFIESQAKILRIPTACATFEQPLWLKAVDNKKQVFKCSMQDRWVSYAGVSIK